MPAFTPNNLIQRPGFWRFADETGIENEAHGHESRFEYVLEAASDVERLSNGGKTLLVDFMKHAGKFDLKSVTIRDAPDDDGASLVLRYSFTATDHPHELQYTYFDVAFKICDPPLERFWPIKFTVGFH
jgi:hypothetical protein